MDCQSSTPTSQNLAICLFGRHGLGIPTLHATYSGVCESVFEASYFSGGRPTRVSALKFGPVYILVIVFNWIDKFSKTFLSFPENKTHIYISITISIMIC
jgi:hypothetical protein